MLWFISALEVSHIKWNTMNTSLFWQLCEKGGKRIVLYGFNFCSFTPLCFAKESNPAISAEQVVNQRAKWRYYIKACQILYLECEPPPRTPQTELLCLTPSQNSTFCIFSGSAFSQLQQEGTEKERIDSKKRVSHQGYNRQKQTDTLSLLEGSGISTTTMLADVGVSVGKSWSAEDIQQSS